MRIGIFAASLVLLAGTGAFASAPIHCTLSLLSPMGSPFPPSYLSIGPESGTYEFDYDPATELAVKLAVVNKVPDANWAQYGLATAKPNEVPALTIEFSKKSIEGQTYEGDDFGVYFRRAKDPKNAAWTMGGYTKAVSSDIEVNGETGYVVMNCK